MSTKSRRTSIAIAAAGLVALAIAIAGCGGGGGGGGGGAYGAARATTPSSGGKASVKLASTELGKVIVDAKGRTLYLFEADKGPMSACSGACASVWPPLTTSGKPSAGEGVTARGVHAQPCGPGEQVAQGGEVLVAQDRQGAPSRGHRPLPSTRASTAAASSSTGIVLPVAARTSRS